MSRKHLMGLDNNGLVLSGVANPSAATDAATKGYVDSVGGWTRIISTQDTSNSTVTAVNIAGLSLSGLANGLYEVEFAVIGVAAVVGTGVQIGVANNTTAPFVGFIWGIGTSGSAQVFRAVASSETAAVVASAGVSVATPALNLAAFGKGLIRVASMVGSVDLTVRSEVAASNVIAKVDSCLVYRKVA